MTFIWFPAMNSAGGLTVCIANHNTAPFLKVSVRALRELGERPLRILVHDDGSDPQDIDQVRELARAHDEIELFERPGKRAGSYAHGDAMDFLMARVETPYTAILDADCTPLMRGWDTYLIGRLDDTTKIIGSTLGEGWSGNKPIDFPLPFLALFETETYRELGISALPGEDTRFQDTCWQWRPKYLGAGYRGECLRSVNTRLTPEPPFGDIHCAVYYTHDGRLLGSHFGRGSNPAGKRAARRSVLATLRRGLGRDPGAGDWAEQRTRWIGTCLELIERHGLRATTR